MNHTESYLIRQIESLDWSIDAAHITRLIKPCLNIRTSETAYVEIGQSKFGGRPDLEATTTWPFINEKPLAFLGQINFDDIENQALVPMALAGKLVSFFICVDYEVYRAPHVFPLIHATIVSHMRSNTVLERRDFPNDLDASFRFQDMALSFNPAFSIPSYQHWSIMDLELSPNDEHIYTDQVDGIFNRAFALNYEPGHRLFGHSHAIQGDTNYPWAQGQVRSIAGYGHMHESVLQRQFELLVQFDLMHDFPSISDGCVYFGYLEDEEGEMHIQCELQNT